MTYISRQRKYIPLLAPVAVGGPPGSGLHASRSPSLAVAHGPMAHAFSALGEEIYTPTWLIDRNRRGVMDHDSSSPFTIIRDLYIYLVENCIELEPCSFRA